MDKVKHLTADMQEEYALTDRESEILYLLINGMSNEEIGKQLFLAEKTVRTYVSTIFIKTGIHTRNKLQAKVIERLCEQ